MQGDLVGEVINATYIERKCLLTPLVYPLKMYFPTRIILNVGPLLSHNEWKLSADQPSTDVSQQRFH